jgi:hypothetical protein
MNKLIDLSDQYGGPAHMAVATFKAHGVTHIARRLWRSDYLKSGKIELYTICPGEEHLGVFAEDFFRYVNEETPTRVDLQAMAAIAAIDQSYGSLHVESAARASAIELA